MPPSNLEEMFSCSNLWFREKSEQTVNVGVVGIHSAQQVAHYASEGNYGKARMLQKANMRMLHRGVKNNPEASSAQKEQLGYDTFFLSDLWSHGFSRIEAILFPFEDVRFIDFFG